MIAARQFTADIAASYGVNEINNISTARYNHSELADGEPTYQLSDKRVVRIDRIRLLTDRGCPFVDVSYVYGTLDNGKHVRVNLGAHQLSRHYKSDLIRLAKEAGRYGKGLGMFDGETISIMY